MNLRLLNHETNALAIMPTMLLVMLSVWLCGLDGAHAHYQFSAGSMMHETAAGSMQAFTAVEPVVGSHHHRAHVPPSSQYTGSLPAHQPPPVHHGHALVDNVYASVPGTSAIFTVTAGTVNASKISYPIEIHF